MAESYRTIHLTGLGKTLEDKIAELDDIRRIVTPEAEQAVIDELVDALENSKTVFARICDNWSRRFKVE